MFGTMGKFFRTDADVDADADGKTDGLVEIAV